MTTVDFPGDTLVNAFAYNALDQRIKKVDSNGVVNFIYDGAGILMETNQSGQILGAYTNGLAGAISKRNATNDYGYLMKDALGTTRNIVDTDQVIKMTYKYDIFGAIREAIGSDPIGIPQTFTGKELDTDSGLHYFGARYYDSALGRFITADTWIWGPDDENLLASSRLASAVGSYFGQSHTRLPTLYSYCRNDPINSRDIGGNVDAEDWASWAAATLATVGLIYLTARLPSPLGFGKMWVLLGIKVALDNIILTSPPGAGKIPEDIRDLFLGLVIYTTLLMAILAVSPAKYGVTVAVLTCIAALETLYFEVTSDSCDQ